MPDLRRRSARLGRPESVPPGGHRAPPGESNRLQRRVESAYEDKLDGRIGAAFFDQKAGEWRAEQERIERAIHDHRQADQSYMEEGLALLELAGRAADLFEKQEPSEKRRLLDFVLSNSTGPTGVLTPVFRPTL
jgi:hypothetical protein